MRWLRLKLPVDKNQVQKISKVGDKDDAKKFQKGIVPAHLLTDGTISTDRLITDIIPFSNAIKAFETILGQERPGYIEKHGSQWIHIYSGRIKPLVNKV